MTDTETNPEVQKEVLLEKINQTLANLGSTSKWKEAPEFLKEYEPLKDKTIVMIDDVLNILENLAPHLIVATEGKASCIKFESQDLDELVQKITESNPDIVLMDYHLSENLKGEDVVKALKEKGFLGDIVGSSSDPRTAELFANAGAKGVIDKGRLDAEDSVKELADLISVE